VRARYPFTPGRYDGGPDEDPERHVDLLAINELVPFVPGTAQVDIVGPEGVLTSVQAGVSPPSVTVLSPNGGEVLSGNEIVVSWNASDPDGDPLTFNVQYSPDNGATWEMVAQNLTGTSATLDATNFVAGSQGRVRVWVSDGINTASDESDGTFVIPNRPPTVRILQPADGTTIFLEQSLNLEADAYDVDMGSLDGAQVQWTSSLDGALG
ncbi:MAG: fibronectin type III domain-containing protein, partial [Caldilineales bacterium]|nr:fibronectin type III domain-containing protein [Caldilineales bacterium]